MRHLFAAAFCVAFLLSFAVRADEIGCVSTDVRMLGLANDKVCVASFADPKVPGVACYISRAQTGGVKGAIGVAEDPSEFSVSCHQIGSISFDNNIKNGEKVFEESRSFWFKTLQVVRFCDKANNTLVYM